MFRKLIKSNAISYHPNAPKLLKTACIDKVWSQLVSIGCRFLVRSSESDKSWVEASDHVAKQNISHAFRDYRKGLFDSIERPGINKYKCNTKKRIQQCSLNRKENPSQQIAKPLISNIQESENSSHEILPMKTPSCCLNCTDEGCTYPFRLECMNCCIAWLNELPLTFLEGLINLLDDGKGHADRNDQCISLPYTQAFHGGTNYPSFDHNSSIPYTQKEVSLVFEQSDDVLQDFSNYDSEMGGKK
jgi:hypothetical protein